MNSCKLYAPLPSISLLLPICFPDIPCHTQWNKIILRTIICLVAIPTEGHSCFILLIAIYLKEKKVGCYGSANKLSPKGDVSVRSAVPRHTRLQADNFGCFLPPKSFDWQALKGCMKFVTKKPNLYRISAALSTCHKRIRRNQTPGAAHTHCIV